MGSYFLVTIVTFTAVLHFITLVASNNDGGIEFPTAIASSKSLENGKKRLDEVMTRMNLPYGKCWLEARANLDIGCQAMDAELHTKLAFAFTSCFLEMMGFPSLVCDTSRNIQHCLKNLDQRGYSTFLEYFQHTQDMCFYLTNQLWQAKTAETVGRLEFAADGVTKNLESTKSAQQQILESQKEAMNMTKNIINDNNQLYNAVVKVKQVFDDFRESADEQRQVFIDIFEKLSKMQRLVSWIQGEMSFMDMFGFYGVVLILGYLVTATEQTKDARFALIILLTTTFIMERSLYKYWTSPEIDMTPDDVQGNVAWIRKFACGVGFTILGYFACTYRDYNRINNTALKGVNVTLDRVNRNMDESFRQLTTQMNRVVRTLSANGGDALENRQDIDAGCDSDSDSSSSSSAYSRDSDSVSTATLIDPEERKQLMEEIKLYFPDVDKENSTPTRQERDPKKGDDGQALGPPILSSTPNAHGSHYNLRARRSSTTNPILKTETPKDFAMTVKAIQKRNGYLIQKRADSYFSSDDEDY